jgi:hypothetical protein
VRVELPEGQWADLREWLPYGLARSVRRASLATRDDPAALADFDIALVRAYVVNWHVLANGEAVPVDRLEDAPDAIVQELFAECLARWNGAPAPLGGSADTPTTLQALA